MPSLGDMARQAIGPNPRRAQSALRDRYAGMGPMGSPPSPGSPRDRLTRRRRGMMGGASMDAGAMGEPGSGPQPGGNLPGPTPSPTPPHWTDPGGQPYQPGYPVPGQDYDPRGYPEPNWGDAYDQMSEDFGWWLFGGRR